MTNTIDEVVGDVLKEMIKKHEITKNKVRGIQLLTDKNEVYVFTRDYPKADEKLTVLEMLLLTASEYKNSIVTEKSYDEGSTSESQEGLYKDISTYKRKDQSIVISIGSVPELDLIRIYFK